MPSRPSKSFKTWHVHSWIPQNFLSSIGPSRSAQPYTSSTDSHPLPTTKARADMKCSTAILLTSAPSKRSVPLSQNSYPSRRDDMVTNKAPQVKVAVAIASSATHARPRDTSCSTPRGSLIQKSLCADTSISRRIQKNTLLCQMTHQRTSPPSPARSPFRMTHPLPPLPTCPATVLVTVIPSVHHLLPIPQPHHPLAALSTIPAHPVNTMPLPMTMPPTLMIPKRTHTVPR